ncbi:hypothetical protein DLAC_06146 [Tieghemostelium lacteum]|uniref:Uncharacterized protein n=1 Tax=Tieghemostelium lacteum TaxID=361077 RepID=A0A151ZHY0_TIELA|nr:hypothetical protein DLAC_06146 [Tieghemostelium lacteum]|eukprot:KYQ93454.1 hypothetical protein DLAC_06146 [Tieghemostelium lacteum]
MESIIKESEIIANNIYNILIKLFKNVKLIIGLSIIVHFAAVFLIFFLPNLGSQTYVSEKNLQCTVIPFITSNFSELAIEYAKTFQNNFPKRSIGSTESIDTAKWIRDQLEQSGIESQLHYFNSSDKRTGLNVIGLNRAVRSQGTESFVLTTAYDQWHSAGSVGFLLAFADYIKKSTWQARDIILVFTQEGGEVNGGTFMDISGISVWLHDYHAMPDEMVGWCDQTRRFLRAGQIYGAIALDRVGNSNMKKLVVYPEGLEGSLSNLDIVNVITTTCFLNDIPAGINTHLPREPVEGSLYGLLVFMWNSALSMPRSNHAIFTRYGINSVGISTDSSHNAWDIDFLNTPLHKIQYLWNPPDPSSPNSELISGNPPPIDISHPSLTFGPLSNETMLNLGKILETVIRHLHNADEQLHQSYRWYMMAGAVFFIDLGQVLLPMMVFIGSIVLLLFSLGIASTSTKQSTNSITVRILIQLPWFFSFLAWCFLQLLLPKFLSSFLHILPNRQLIPSNFNLSIPLIREHSIEDQIILLSCIYILFCFVIYKLIFQRIANFYTTILILHYPNYRNDWMGLQTILLLYYSLLGLMGMMLNNQFTCLFVVLSIPTLHITTWILTMSESKKSTEKSKKSRLFWFLVKIIWLIICLFSHPTIMIFEWWTLWSIGWKKLFIGILVGFDNWGYLFYPFFVIGLLPIYFGIVKLLFFNKSTIPPDNPIHSNNIQKKNK